DPVQSAQAAALFQQAQTSDEIELVVSVVTWMEVFYVLTRAYDLPRAQAAGLLTELLHTGAVTCPESEAVQATLSRITGQKISFGDAYLAASAAAENAEVATFDQGIASFTGVRLYALGSPAKRSGKRRT